jgi:hypothetical protein
VNDFDLKDPNETDEENLQAILKTAESVDCFVIGAGTGKAKNKVFQHRFEQVLTALLPYEAKLYCLCDEEGGSKGLHPLSPRVRHWHLCPCKICDFIDVPIEEPGPKKKGKSKPSTKQTEG